jgi:hypothetical protein
VRRAVRLAAAFFAVAILALGGSARADITILHSEDGFEFYTTGRIGAFIEVLKGDGIPQDYGPLYDPTTGDPVIDPATGRPALAPIHQPGNGGIGVQGDPVEQPPESCGGKPPCFRQGPVLASRVRSGFLGNILAFGVRKHLTDSTTLTGHVAIWGTTETDSRRTFYRNFPDWREAYIRVDGPAGSLQFGRALSLFSRGAIEIDFLYGHQFGVGNPAGFDDFGPSAGHIGYGVIAPVFVAGLQYATPKFHGLQLTAGYFDPGTLVGLYWTRTKFGRPEAEATYDLVFASAGKLHLFANGAFQKMYATDLPRSVDVYGAGYGGRIELGRVHLGVAGHYGQGLGVGYFLDGSDAVVAQFTTQALRKFAGYYAQGQIVLGNFDVNAGWGITRVYSLQEDIDPNWCMPTAGQTCPGFDATTREPQRSFLKSQMGVSGVLVYHYSPRLHFALDYFLSDVTWQQGEQQIMHSFNVGSTLTW